MKCVACAIALVAGPAIVGTAAQSGQSVPPAGAPAAAAPPTLATFDTTKTAKLELSDSTARYRVAEQLVGLNVLSDAVGTTNAVTGVLMIGRDGSVGRESRVTIDLRTLKSDQEPRDNFIRRTLETDKVPMLEFVPSRTKGMPGLRGSNVAGRETATLAFGDFKIAKPAVPVLLSVEDKIQIEVEFRATRSAL